MNKSKGSRTSTDCTRNYMSFGVAETKGITQGLQRVKLGKVRGYITEGHKWHVKEFGVDLIGDTKISRLLNWRQDLKRFVFSIDHGLLCGWI